MTSIFGFGFRKHTRTASARAVSLLTTFVLLATMSGPAVFAFPQRASAIVASCSADPVQTIVSHSSSTKVEEVPATVITPHVAWATIAGASWLWTSAETDANTDSAPAGDTHVFVVEFSIAHNPTTSSVEFAADNQYDVRVNGTSIDSSVADANYNPTRTVTIPAANLNTGLNTITFTITNGPDVPPGNNPAGVAFKITINSESCAPLFTSAPVTSASTVSAYSYTVTTSGTGPITITETGALPPGISFIDNGNGTAILSGTPTTDGSYPITLTATNIVGSAVQTFTIEVTTPCDGWTLEHCVLGSVNAQDSWKSTGSFDQAVVANTFGVTSFGTKTFRISNAVTSGSFGDQTFVKPSANEAGEQYSSNNGSPVGVRQNHFVAQFEMLSATSTEQAGLAMTVSPDRGDGSRMSYLRFVDTEGGIDVTFYDVQGESNPANFVPTVIATDLDRTVPHTIKFDMTFVEGPSNDIVKIYIDGSLVHTGTSWENYYRFDSESAAEQAPRTTNTLLFRSSGTAVPATSGAGFLFDNFNLVANHVAVGSSEATSTTVVRLADLDVGPVATALTNGSGKWFIYNDTTDVIDNTLGSFVLGPNPAPSGIGSIEFLLGAANARYNIATYAYSGTPLSQITSLKYSAYSYSGVSSPTESPFLAFNVDFTGISGTFQKRLVYVPANNGAVPQDQWNTFDTINSGLGMWVYSGATWPVTAVGPHAGVIGAAGSTPRSWSSILADYPSIRLLPVGGWLGVRTGEPGPIDYRAHTDNITVGVNNGATWTTKTYNLEPTLLSDVSVTKVVNNPAPTTGSTVTYTLTVSNTGDDAYGVTVHDVLPAGLAFVSTSTTDTVGVYNSVTGDWNIGNLSSTTSVTLHIVATVTTSSHETVTNIASVSDAYSIDPNTSNNSASAAITVPTPSSGGGGGNGPISGSFPSFGGGQVLGISTTTGSGGSYGASCGEYLTAFIRPGQKNDAEQVRRLQYVLATIEHMNVPQDGVYGPETIAAVKAFQLKYASRILAPWGLTQPTGNVYLTTRRVINEIYCKGASLFPLTPAEQATIDAYRAHGSNSPTPVRHTPAQVPVQQPEISTPVVESTPNESSQPGAVGAPTQTFFSQLGSFFSNLFGN